MTPYLCAILMLASSFARLVVLPLFTVPLFGQPTNLSVRDERVLAYSKAFPSAKSVSVVSMNAHALEARVLDHPSTLGVDLGGRAIRSPSSSNALTTPPIGLVAGL
jgi:hypothetical protein